jgi:hypothetical protein
MKISKWLVVASALVALTSASALADGSTGQEQSVGCPAGSLKVSKDESPASAPAGQPPAGPMQTSGSAQH